jgi:hypothetical protein
MGGGPGVGRKPKRKALVTPEQLAEIEKMYKAALPLPNPDLHELMAEKLGIPGSKTFFGINLIRQKMKLPKLDFPKRKLAVSPDQLTAVQALYDSFLPMPPIGVHKIIAKQLKMDEWRVHVAIKLIRKSRNLPQFNEDRQDVPDWIKELMEKNKADMARRDAELLAEAAAKAEAGEAPTTGEVPESPEANTDDTPEPDTPSEAEEAPPPAPKKTSRKAAPKPEPPEVVADAEASPTDGEAEAS